MNDIPPQDLLNKLKAWVYKVSQTQLQWGWIGNHERRLNLLENRVLELEKKRKRSA
jgi:hypothetical protein